MLTPTLRAGAILVLFYRLTLSPSPSLECPPQPSFSVSVRLVAGDERSCPSSRPDFSVPLQQQMAGFPVAGGRHAVRRGVLLLDFHLFLQVNTRALACLVGCGRTAIA